MPEDHKTYARREVLLHGLVAGAVTLAILAISVFASTEATMGHAQRIVYVHVAVAWFALVSFVGMAGTGLVYLVTRDLGWDQWSASAAEVGWLAAGLTLVTGSLWAHEAWGTWWTWDPRLATAFILWAIYSGYLIVRASLEDPHGRARVGAVLAILGVLDVPLVVVATRLFRGIHPAAPEMELSMRVVLLISVVGFSGVFALLVLHRRRQARIESMLVRLEQAADAGPWQPEQEKGPQLFCAKHPSGRSGKRAASPFPVSEAGSPQ